MPDALPDLPPLPEPDGVVAYEARPYEPEWISSEGAYTAEQMFSYAREAVRAALAERDAELSHVRATLRELAALVRGECPSLLEEDSGGDARLDMAIDDAIAAEKEKSHD